MRHELQFVILKKRVLSLCGGTKIDIEKVIDYLVEFSELTHLQISEENSTFETHKDKIMAIIGLRSDKPVYEGKEEEYVIDDEYFFNHKYILNDWRN